MKKEIIDFAKPVGMGAASQSIQSYREIKGIEFKDEWVNPMNYASGYTSYVLTKAFTENWINPLKKRLVLTGIGLIISIGCSVTSVLYLWFLINFETFVKFFAAFLPSVVALLYTLAKIYKTWAEARKTLIEAKMIQEKADSIYKFC